MAEAYIALGTNIGNKKENINNALTSIALLPETSIVKTSCIYESEPWGYALQDNFLNSAVKIETGLSEFSLLGACLGIEAAMGRKRSIKNGPRIIDIDLLCYGTKTVNTKELILPHPRMLERVFVLKPLCEICDNKIYKDALECLDKTKAWIYNE